MIGIGKINPVNTIGKTEFSKTNLLSLSNKVTVKEIPAPVDPTKKKATTDNKPTHLHDIFITLGVVIILVAIGIFLYQYYTVKRERAKSHQYLNQVAKEKLSES